jgi:hypothetical protein
MVQVHTKFSATGFKNSGCMIMIPMKNCRLQLADNLIRASSNINIEGCFLTNTVFHAAR